MYNYIFNENNINLYIIIIIYIFIFSKIKLLEFKKYNIYIFYL